jgi:hypothetical protein
MPGAMHFAVVDGQAQLYGVETDDVYHANLEVFRRTYEERLRLQQALDPLRQVLPALRKDPTVKEKAEILLKDVDAVEHLIMVQTVPEELSTTLGEGLGSVNRLKQILPKEVGDSLLESLSAGGSFLCLSPHA